ncbi:META domain-containing protein [Pedobacter africanus]|uniref:Heat shock protein HslJ n=1 Tax=Pedobacter africanus TaxID=151894 RepID=A0A1W2ALI1_9SPHI|nr:META domain-containing protein [Pedobacter africanus]SMC61546.1 Heat shock protein HslJ [Pedobacter africanus]
MKKIIFLILISISGLTACNTMKQNKSAGKLTGDWVLNYITGPRIAFDGLFPNDKPTINFKENPEIISGNTSCNGFSCKLTIKGNNMSISQPGPMTMRYCEGGGEKVFLDMLQKVTGYDVQGNTLVMLQGDIVVMRYTRK